MNTSLKIFNQNKIFGSGPKSYRHSCVEMILILIIIVAAHTPIIIIFSFYQS